MDKGSHNSNERIFNTPFGRPSEKLLNLLGKKQRHFLIVSGDKGNDSNVFLKIINGIFGTGDVLLLNTELNCKDKHSRISE